MNLIQGFLRFNKGVLAMPRPWLLWIVLMVAVNLIVPLFFLGRLEAQVTAVVFVAGVVLMSILTTLVGFTRLLGLGHVLWFPLLYFLWTRSELHPPEAVYGLWLRAVMTINAMSLVIDVTDVVRYLAGERDEVVEIRD